MRHNLHMIAKRYFNAMLSEGIEHNRHTYKLYESLGHASKALTYEKIMHGLVKKHDKVALNMFVGYMSLNCIPYADKAFDEFLQPNVFLWSATK
ncbi:unnamed protein product [Malus baccata var. baccata]